MKSKNVLIALFISIMWGIVSPIGRYLVGLNQSISSVQLSFLRYSIGFLTLLTINIFNKGLKFTTIKEYKGGRYKFIIAGIILVAFVVILFIGLESTTASIGGIMLNTNALLIGLFSYFLLKQEIHSNEIIGLLSGMLGVIILFIPSIIGEAQGTFTGALLSFVAGMIWAVYSIILKTWFENENALEVTIINLGIASIILGIAIIPYGLPELDLLALFLILIIAIGSTGLAFYAYLYIVSRETVVVAGALQLLIPVISIFFGIILFNEVLVLLEWIGIVIILISMIIIFD